MASQICAYPETDGYRLSQLPCLLQNIFDPNHNRGGFVHISVILGYKIVLSDKRTCLLQLYHNKLGIGGSPLCVTVTPSGRQGCKKCSVTYLVAAWNNRVGRCALEGLVDLAVCVFRADQKPEWGTVRYGLVVYIGYLACAVLISEGGGGVVYTRIYNADQNTVARKLQKGLLLDLYYARTFKGGAVQQPNNIGKSRIKVCSQYIGGCAKCR